MTAQVLTIEALTANTRSTDLFAGANMVSCAATDTFTLTPTQNRTEDLIIAIKGSGSATVTINAGTNPPGGKAGLGNITVSITTNEVRLIMLDATRVFSSAVPATITGSVATNTVLIGAFRIPRTV